MLGVRPTATCGLQGSRDGVGLNHRPWAQGMGRARSPWWGALVRPPGLPHPELSSGPQHTFLMSHPGSSYGLV